MYSSVPIATSYFPDLVPSEPCIFLTTFSEWNRSLLKHSRTGSEEDGVMLITPRRLSTILCPNPGRDSLRSSEK